MIAAVSPPMQMLDELAGFVEPMPFVDTWEWICENGRMPDGTPFDGSMLPWCRGVCEAWDDPEYRIIANEWGTRLGKTTIALQKMAKVAATSPAPGLFATSTEKLAHRTVRGKIYPVLGHVNATRDLLPPERLRSLDEIRLASGSWHVAYSGSATTLADLSAFYGWGNEVDKWTMDKRQGGDAGEGDSLTQFFERFKEFWETAKINVECSPSTLRLSRIHALVTNSTNCRYWVACPSCKKRQPLRFGKEGEPGGIRFDRNPDGTSDPKLARQTSRYVCLHCKYEIHDDQRFEMMQGGVWVPKGQGADKRGRLTGPKGPPTRTWGSQLSSLYSLQLRWGDIAEEFLVSKGNPEKRRMFVNGWLAEPWEPYKTKTDPEKVGERLTVDVPRGKVPEWATWLFAGIDRQDDHYVYVVIACDSDEREHVVDHGTCEEAEDLRRLVIEREFEHMDGGQPLVPALTLIDSGHKTAQIYKFCQKFRRTRYDVRPCKGANSELGGENFTDKLVVGPKKGGKSRRKARLARIAAGLRFVHVNSWYYEPVIQEQLDLKSPGDSGCLTFHADCADDISFLHQICNGAESHEPSKNAPDRCLWVKRWQDDPNDYRDCKKYTRCAMDVCFKNDWRKAERRQVPLVAPAPREETADSEPARRVRHRHQRSHSRGERRRRPRH